MPTHPLKFSQVTESMTVFCGTPSESQPLGSAMPMQAWSLHSPQAVVIDDTAYHFGASLKDLGKNTFFFSKEDFTLKEVLKR